jgi:HJR/Mrr/RecB family endonuclease
VAVRSKCSAASATKETPAIAAFSHFLYAADETRPNDNQLTKRSVQKIHDFRPNKVKEYSSHHLSKPGNSKIKKPETRSF